MVRIRVKVSPGAKSSEVMGKFQNMIKVRVKAVPEKGRANQVLCDFIAQKLKIARTKVMVVSGQASRLKTIEIGADLQVEDIMTGLLAK